MIDSIEMATKMRTFFRRLSASELRSTEYFGGMLALELYDDGEFFGFILSDGNPSDRAQHEWIRDLPSVEIGGGRGDFKMTISQEREYLVSNAGAWADDLIRAWESTHEVQS
jgi:hypothetical protein